MREVHLGAPAETASTPNARPRTDEPSSESNDAIKVIEAPVGIISARGIPKNTPLTGAPSEPSKIKVIDLLRGVKRENGEYFFSPKETLREPAAKYGSVLDDKVEKHQLSREMLGELPGLLSDPVMVFDSVRGRDLDHLLRWIDEGKTRYWNKEKTRSWLKTSERSRAPRFGSQLESASLPTKESVDRQGETLREDGPEYGSKSEAVRRVKTLQAKAAEGRLTQVEEAERVALEKELGQEFMGFHAEQTQREDAALRRRMEAQAEMDKRIQAGPIESQGELLDKLGQMEFFEKRKAHYDALWRGEPTDERGLNQSGILAEAGAGTGLPADQPGAGGATGPVAPNGQSADGGAPVDIQDSIRVTAAGINRKLSNGKQSGQLGEGSEGANPSGKSQ
ncbi:MAG: hypothetical protein H8E27_09160 [Verrucomicrobia subdivision 3 bacterium]|nr:hypothetical protein [Limisphaerales bacterium]